MGKKYLIYMDILGYKKKAEELAEISGFEESVCRENYLRTPLKKKIEDMKTTKFRGISAIEGSDNYLILVDTIEEVIEIIGEITRIKIPHKDFQWIPLEIGVGTKKINEDIPLEPISRTEVITFLKEDIINPYRDYFKQNYKESVRNTFVLFTEDFYNDLEPLDKHHCTPICHKGKSFFLGNLEKIHERCKIYEFLRKIGYPGSRMYGRIDEVYVPPVEFADIQNTLKEKRIVFITGTQEYGKTYTAVRLLWEYFCGGYEVEWVKGEGERGREEVRRWLLDIGAKMNPHQIVYFEDPFGKTRYEKREYLEKEMGTIIESVKNVEDSYVIITSREEVFKEFKKGNLSAVDVKEFEESMNLGRPSYDYEKREEIVTKWAKEEECGWVNNARLRNTVFEEIRDERNLTTPLKMRGFAVATVKVNEEDILIKEIKEKSEETARAFADEIRNMSLGKIVLLSFLFVSYYPVDFMRSIYEEMVEELRLVDASDFDEVLYWFRDDKIRVGDYVEFSHPSYSRALKYLIGGNGSFRRKYGEIFGKNLLFKLAEKDEAAGAVVWFVVENFYRFPENMRNLLFKLAVNNKAAGTVADAVAKNFDKLPEDVRNLLFKLAVKDRIAWPVARAVVENFDKLPENVRNRLLFILAEKDEAAWPVARAVVENFDKLPENVRNLLFTLAEKDEAGDIAQVMVENFDKLPENVRNLLFTLAEKDEAAWPVARAVVENFYRLPENVRNLLLKLAEKDEAAWRIAQVVVENFYRLPENLRNRLLFTLAVKDEAAGTVAWFVARDFDHLSESLRNILLFKLAEKNRTAGSIAWAVVENFNKFPENLRNRLLFTLAEKGEVAGTVAWFVARDFDHLSESLRNGLLFKLAEKDEIAWRVACTVEENFEKLPEDVRNNLLLELSKKEESAGIVKRIIRDNFDKLPENIKKLGESI